MLTTLTTMILHEYFLIETLLSKINLQQEEDYYSEGLVSGSASRGRQSKPRLRRWCIRDNLLFLKYSHWLMLEYKDYENNLEYANFLLHKTQQV